MFLHFSLTRSIKQVPLYINKFSIWKMRKNSAEKLPDLYSSSLQCLSEFKLEQNTAFPLEIGRKIVLKHNSGKTQFWHEPRYYCTVLERVEINISQLGLEYSHQLVGIHITICAEEAERAEHILHPQSSDLLPTECAIECGIVSAADELIFH